MITTTQPFWPTTFEWLPQHEQLLQALFAAHAEAARRESVSTMTLQAAFFGSGSYTQALCAALCTLGGPHAPLRQAYELLTSEEPVMAAADLLMRGERVPGWGNSFVKGEDDPLFDPIWDLMNHHAHKEFETMVDITRLLHREKKMIYPNPACYTAAVALALEIPVEIVPWLFVAGRLETWTGMLISHRDTEAQRPA